MTPRQLATDALLGMVAMLLRSVATTAPDQETRLAARELLQETRARRAANKDTQPEES